jgi:MinD-like ATPase involved in chromosome partitioning or flagellar assembly
MPKRIIPVASGKGGVGKTTFAVHFALALSRRAPTVLVDLDTATSSVRGAIDVPVAKDLYHFHRKGEPLAGCVTRLDASVDRDGRFRDFGFVAAPRHYLEDLADPGPELRRRLAAGIQSLPCDYVVLDLRAGVDANVMEFLPYTNSGVLVFTPQLPQATAAAADICKAIVFRTLRAIFTPASEVWTLPELAGARELVVELLDRAEDAYDDAVPHLDAMLRELGELVGASTFVDALAALVAEFRVHYVLNQFDGVEPGHERAVVPFVRNLTENVSSRLDLTQLGWVVQDAALQRASRTGRPCLLDEPRAAPAAAPRPAAPAHGDPVLAEIAALRSAYLGVERRPVRRAAPAAATTAPPPSVDGLLDEQLGSLRAMFSDRNRDGVRENFAYCVFRALHLMQPPRLPTEFGMTQLAQPAQLVRWLLRRLPGSAGAA